MYLHGDSLLQLIQLVFVLFVVVLICWIVQWLFGTSGDHSFSLLLLLSTLM